MRRIAFNNTDVPKVTPRTSHHLFGELEGNSILTFSGKSALALLLEYFRTSGALENKMAEVLVPPWLGTWVYRTMQNYCFPTTEFNPRVRGILLYHQWGFPQHTDEVLAFAKKHKLFVIEDCAHAFESYTDGKRLGTFGDAAIFSLAKFFPCVVGGAIYTTNPAIRKFVASKVKHIGELERAAFAQRMRYDKHPSAKNSLELERQYALYYKLRACDPRALAIATSAAANGSIEKRKMHVHRLRQEFDPQDTFGLFNEDIAPWIFPVFFNAARMRRVVAALEKKGFETGIFHFDVNRNMLHPDYRECVALPCHDGITEAHMVLMIRIVRDTK